MTKKYDILIISYERRTYVKLKKIMNETMTTTEKQRTERKLFTYEERRKILKSTGGICACCGKKLTTKTMTVEHIIPIHRGGTNDPENLTALCETCNKHKNNAMFLPSSFYMAMVRTGWIRNVENMVRTWLKTDAIWENDTERYPMLMPEQYILMSLPNMKPVFSKQLLYVWRLILAKQREEMQAITDVNSKTINRMLHRPNDDPKYEEYGIPIQYYVLKKANTDKYLSVIAVRYDRTERDLVVYLLWKDPSVTKFGSQQIFTTALACLYDAIITIAEDQINHALLLSNYDNCFDYFVHCKFQDYGKSAQYFELYDTIEEKPVYCLSYNRFPAAKPRKPHQYFDFPPYIQYKTT